MSLIDDAEFTWCNSFFRVKENYTKHDFYLTAKKYLVSKEGVDKKFLKAFLDIPEDKFSYCCRFVPVYKITAKIQYSWTVESSDTVHGTFESVTVTTSDLCSEIEYRSEFYYWGITYRIKPDTFLNSQSFYKVKLPSELGYKIYNVSNNCTTFEHAEKIAEKLPRYYEKKSSKLLSWICDVYFVPVCYIPFEYNGEVYYLLFNLHNGKCETNYLMSAEAANIAETACKTQEKYNKYSLIILITSLAVLLGQIIYAFFIEVFAGIILLVLNGIWGWLFNRLRDELTSTEDRHYIEYYGQSTAMGDKLLKKSKTLFIIFIAVTCVCLTGSFILVLL